jgi:hypothetical protein
MLSRRVIEGLLDCLVKNTIKLKSKNRYSCCQILNMFCCTEMLRQDSLDKKIVQTKTFRYTYIILEFNILRMMTIEFLNAQNTDYIGSQNNDIIYIYLVGKPANTTCKNQPLPALSDDSTCKNQPLPALSDDSTCKNQPLPALSDDSTCKNQPLPALSDDFPLDPALTG